jgi:hypothetical protein
MSVPFSSKSAIRSLQHTSLRSPCGFLARSRLCSNSSGPAPPGSFCARSLQLPSWRDQFQLERRAPLVETLRTFLGAKLPLSPPRLKVPLLSHVIGGILTGERSLRCMRISAGEKGVLCLAPSAQETNSFRRSLCRPPNTFRPECACTNRPSPLCQMPVYGR